MLERYRKILSYLLEWPRLRRFWNLLKISHCRLHVDLPQQELRVVTAQQFVWEGTRKVGGYGFDVAVNYNVGERHQYTLFGFVLEVEGVGNQRSLEHFKQLDALSAHLHFSEVPHIPERILVILVVVNKFAKPLANVASECFVALIPHNIL